MRETDPDERCERRLHHRARQADVPRGELVRRRDDIQAPT
jgi:hypothetical protein